jgi:hypothetical protein
MAPLRAGQDMEPDSRESPLGRGVKLPSSGVGVWPWESIVWIQRHFTKDSYQFVLILILFAFGEIFE